MALPGLMMPLGFMSMASPPFSSLVFTSSVSLQRGAIGGSYTNAQRFTYSIWVKRTSGSGTIRMLAPASGDNFLIGHDSGSVAFSYTSGANNPLKYATFSWSSNVWRHVVVRFDSTVTANDRIRLYVNGSLLTNIAFQDDPPSNNTHDILGQNIMIGSSFTGRMAFATFVDGQSLAPTSFGVNNSGTWSHRPYTGSYGNKGFSIDGSTSTVGEDVSGRGNHFTSSGGSVVHDSSDLPPMVL